MLRKTVARGFTLVELLVVISIIGLLAGLMLPAINSAREQGRRADCINNQKNIALAITMFEQNKGKFPQYHVHTERRLDNDPHCASETTGYNVWVDLDGVYYTSEVGWIPQLFPYVEQTLLWEEINRYGCTKGNCDVTLELFICKSSGALETNANTYVGNCGIADHWPYVDTTKAYGIFTDGVGYGNEVGKTLSIQDVKDGLSNTLLISENLQAGTIWVSREWLVGFCVNSNGMNGGNTDNGNIDYSPFFNEGSTPEDNPGVPLRPNLFRDEANNNISSSGFCDQFPVFWNSARMSSSHPGVVVAAMADGSTRVISENIEAEVLTKAMAPNDKATAFWKNNLFQSRSFDASKLNE